VKAPDPAHEPGQETALRTQLARGARWTLAAHGARQLLTLVFQIILARLLAPEDFGLLAMVVVFSGFASMLVDLGFGPALVQAPAAGPRQALSVWWITLLAGSVLAGLTFAAGPAVATFYGQPVLASVAALLAMQIWLSALAVVPTALLSRELRLRALGMVDILAGLSGGLVAVALALGGHGALALASQLVAASAVTAVGVHLVARFRPRLCFDLAAVRELVGFSSHLVGYRVFEYWVRSADKLLIGRFVGAAGLGLYSRAYSTMLIPVSQVGDVAGRVMFPALCRLRSDAARSRELYLRALRGIALVSFPLMTTLFVLADEFLVVVFGPPWAGATDVLRVLCAVGLMQSIGTTTGWIYRSQGRADWQFRFGIAAGTSALLAFAIGVNWGILGVAVAYLVRNLALTWFNFAIPGRLIGLRYRHVVASVGGILACALMAAGALAVFDAALSAPEGGILAPEAGLGRLVAKLAFGGCAYLGLVAGFRLRALGEVMDLVTGAFGSPRGAPQDAVEALSR